MSNAREGFDDPGRLSGCTLDDVVEELIALRIDVQSRGRLREVFWGVALGVTVGVPLIGAVVLIVAAVAGVGIGAAS